MLGDRLLAVTLHVGLAPGIAIVKQRMLDPLGISAADAEGDRLCHILDDRADAICDCCERRV